MDKSKLEALQKAIGNIEKEYGKGSIMKMDDALIQKVPVISTGSFSLDKALGIGGFPKGRILEIYGPESAGKSTLALSAVAQAQKNGEVCAYVDAEHALSRELAVRLGVDIKELYLSQPESGEQGLEIVEELVRSKAVSVVVVDSVAALVPKAEIEGEMGEAHMALQARLMSQALRKLTSIVSNSGTCVIMINQLRCLPLDSMIICDGRFKRLFKIKKEDNVLCKNEKYVGVINYTSNNLVDGKRLELKYRGYFDLSDNHLQPIIRKGEVKEIKGKDLKINDWVIQPILDDTTISDNTPYINLEKYIETIEINSKCKKIKLPKQLDEDFAFFLGCYYSDGYMLEGGEGKDFKISFTENNRERFKLIENICYKLFSKDNIYITDTNIVINRKILVLFLKNLGVTPLGKTKNILDIIIESRASVIKAFIRGAFFDTHGFTQFGFIFSNENKDSIQIFSNILYGFGIFSDLRKDRATFYNRLHITGIDAVKFNKVFGFSELKKQEYGDKFTYDKSARGKFDVVPYDYVKLLYKKIKNLKIKGLASKEYYNAFNVNRNEKLNFSREGLISFIQGVEGLENELYFLLNNRFTYITSIKKISFDALDLEVKGNNTFICNSVLTHNSKIGVFFGNPETTTGGNALKFYASLRLDVRRGDLFKKGEDVIGHKIKVKVIKNKLAAPHKVAEISFYYDRGFDNVTDLFNFAVNLNIIERSGSWFSFEGERLGQGSENCLEVLKNNPSLLEKIKSLVEKQLSSSSSLIDIPKEEMEQVLKESEEPELDEIIEPKINTNVVSEVTPTVVKTRGRPKKENKEEVSQ